MATPPPTPPADDSRDLQLLLDLLAARVVERFTAAQLSLIDKVARIARQRKPASMHGHMRNAASHVAITLRASLPELVALVMGEAYRGGNRAALSRTATLLSRPFDQRPHSVAGAAAIEAELMASLEAATGRIVRFADDAYRAATAGSAINEIMTGMTPAAAQRAAWDALTARGVTGFTDTAGRRWNLASYVEMATRSATSRAYNAAHQSRMEAAGIEFFTVAPHAHPCPLCMPWEGAVLSSIHSPGPVDAKDPGGAVVPVRVTATVEEARTAGLFHPNCTHVLVAWIPGVSVPHVRPAWTDDDQARYDATQRLRALERKVRTLKQQQAGALTPMDAARYARQVRTTQAQIRALVDEHGLVRRRRREQIDLANH